ncbi:uncharacterized protein LOC127259366 isoform X2 [Andrographis paniculata]|uniref:uncharacterized protein LOC127259366 isoform X2 n=1 Tax=Andrographis paniculata TaxID=175694 RepID=UPI0021E7DEA9|nr:uncharacterized protein LOC127259366 isoform X2 [Andrographis paniculata]
MDSAQQRKKPLFADLFKSPNRNTVAEKGQQNIAAAASNPASWSSGSSWNHSFLSCDSSSSGFSTPPYSDLGSSGSEDDGDFIEELTRQIAERMLQEDDEEDTTTVGYIPEASEQAINRIKDSGNNDVGLCSSRVNPSDQTPPIQVYELKNQPPLPKPAGRRRRVTGTESAHSQKKPLHKTAPQHHCTYTPVNGYTSGSGMQAVYLGGSGSGLGGQVGTGVFLPRVAVTRESDSATRDPSQLRKKSGCSVVLIPTRVLQVLEKYHYNRLQDLKDQSGQEVDEEKTSENGEEEGQRMELPKEWTY